MTVGTGRLRFARPALFCAFFLGGIPIHADTPARDAIAKASALRLAESPDWLRLGHWKPRRWGGGVVSDALSAGFFLSSDGTRDPEAELIAMIAGLYEQKQGSGTELARCRFPARSTWLIERLGLDPASLPPADCSKYEDWRRLLDPTAVSFIFASAYLNNPASMFGHTFLRLERRATGAGSRLLDNTLNFAAETGDDGGLLFAVKGLLGLYPGKYNINPYYMMVHKYNNIESRDLWEYRLALSANEVERLAAHIWEMGPANFPYYFFSKNCSYQLLPALEAVMPGRRLKLGRSAVVSPVDTIHALRSSPGLVAAVSYRPSHATTMRLRRNLLAWDERRASDAFRSGRPEKGDQLMAGLPPERRALILDVAQDYILYKEGYTPDAPVSVRSLEREILTRRARLAVASVEPASPSWAAPPELGHLRRRFQLGAGARDGRAFAEFSWRPGYQDLLDRPGGYVPGAQIEGLSWRLRYDQHARHAYIRDLRIIEILSVSGWDPWIRKPSWIAGTGLDTAFELGKPAVESLVYEGHLGAGLALEFSPRALGYSLLVLESAAGSALREGWRVGGSLRAGATVDLSSRWRGVLEAGLSAQPFGDKRPNHRLRLGLNWAPRRDRALRAEFLLRGRYREGGLYTVLYH